MSKTSFFFFSPCLQHTVEGTMLSPPFSSHVKSNTMGNNKKMNFPLNKKKKIKKPLLIVT